MIQVEIWSDFACPFCFIGKRHFDAALSQFAQKDAVQVTYRNFELDPSAPKSQTISIYEVLAKKYGRSIEWAQQANQNVIAMGQATGLDFHIEKIIPSNSFDAHRLLHVAREAGLQQQWQEAVFTAYFTEGRDIALQSELTTMANAVGLNPEQVQNVLNSDRYTDEVRDEENTARELGISGVPCFVFNRSFGVSGAQPPEALLQALQKAAE